MKIVSIKFLNLNSLKGEQEIRFDRVPFTESGLFAITGPTGAGKTTILDAITVALYGRVHRHNKDASEIMSRHTAECFSEVEFEVGDKLYRTKWSLRRSRGKVNGALQPVKMELAEVATGAFLGGHTLTSIQQAIVDLCGLDYHQFLRSVILSQGDFTKFLKADENERSDLLERITDTGIYSEISKFIFERTKQEKEKLDGLRSRLNDVELLSAGDRTVYEDRLLQLSIEEKENKNEHGQIVKKITWLSNLYELELKKTNLASQLTEQQQLLDEHKEDFNRLNQHKQAMEFRPALVEIKSWQDQSDKLKEDQEKLILQLPSLQKESEKAEFDLEESKKHESRAQQELADAKDLLEKVIQLDSELEGVKAQVNRISAAFENSCREVDDLVQKEEEKTEDFRSLQIKINELQLWLHENKEDATLEGQLLLFRQYNKKLNDVFSEIESARKEQERYMAQDKEDRASLDKNRQVIDILKKEISEAETGINRLTDNLKSNFEEKSLEDLELEASKLPSLISLCEQQLKLAKAYLSHQKKGEELSQKISLDKGSYQEQTTALEALHKQKESAEAHLDNLRQLVELQQRIQKYDAARQQLQPEKPCPLCGSLHHPYVINHNQSELTEAEKKRNGQDRFVRELTEEMNRKSVDANSLKLAIQSREEQLEQLAISVNEIVREFKHNNTLLPKDLDIENAETINAIIVKKQGLFEELQKSIKALRDIKQQQDNNQKLLSSKRELLVQTESRSESILVKLESGREHLSRLSKLVNNLTEDQTTIVTDLSTLLARYHIEYDFQYAEKIEQVLLERLDHYLKAGSRLQQLSLDHTRVNTEIKSVGEALADKLSTKLKLEAEVGVEKAKYQKLKSERLELFGIKNPSMEWARLNQKIKENRDLCERAQLALQQKQEHLKITESRLSQRVIELDDSIQKLSGLKGQLIIDLQLQGIQSIEALKQLFLPEHESQHLAGLQKSIETRISTLSQMLASTEAEIRVEADKDLTTQTVEELKPVLDELDAVISAINQEIGGIRQILENDNRLKVRFAEVANDIEVQQQEYTRWFRLSSLIGSADGKKFSRFAQGLTLARLTDLANRHLVKLSDRYRILKSKEKDLELQIVDGYQADVVRPMATLSGGESFLVSLALALGLSDLASRKVQINSLFIDEGFGTLDAETLDVAISALENLQAKGKSIGIISHVEALKERIGTQIQVNKQPGGSSKIRVLSHHRQLTEIGKDEVA